MQYTALRTVLENEMCFLQGKKPPRNDCSELFFTLPHLYTFCSSTGFWKSAEEANVWNFQESVSFSERLKTRTLMGGYKQRAKYCCGSTTNIKSLNTFSMKQLNNSALSLTLPHSGENMIDAYDIPSPPVPHAPNPPPVNPPPYPGPRGKKALGALWTEVKQNKDKHC